MDLVKAVQQLIISAGEKSFEIDSTYINQLNFENECDYDVLATIVLTQVFENYDNPKVLRRHLKLCVNSLHKHATKIFEKNLSHQISCLFSRTDQPFPFSIISFLLEDCPPSHRLLSLHFEELIEKACSISNLLSLPQQADEEKFYGAIKVLIQVLQFMKKDVTNCLVSSTENYTLRQLLSIVSNCLIMMRQCRDFSGPLRNMCGVLIGHMLNYESDDIAVARLLFNLLDCNRKFEKPAGPFSKIIVEESVDLTEEDKNTFVTILLKGLFSCIRPSVFVAKVCPENDSTFLHFSFRTVYQGIAFLGDSQYHGFQVLKLWWTKACDVGRTQDTIFSQSFFGAEGHFVQSTLDILFQHWDNPISGVSALALDIFTLVMKAHLSLCDNQKTTPLTEKLLNEFTELSSSAKGKYSFISTLLTLTNDNSFVKKYPQFLEDLIPSLGINHLCPAISKTYRTIVTLTVRKAGNEDCRTTWMNYLVPGLIKALAHSDPLIRTNASLYWLPVHLKQIPDAFHQLFTAVNNHFSESHSLNCDWIECKLLALISIARVARSENLILLCEAEESLLHRGLSSFSDSVRAEAYSLVCRQTKTSEMISDIEITLMRLYLPLNMNNDSATFRQQLVFCVKSFIRRVRDSSAAFVKKNDGSRECETGRGYVVSCEDIFQFIMDLCLRSLNICFTYQRKKTAIDIFSTLCSVVIPKTPSGVFTKMLLTEKNRVIIYEMLSDTIPDIRSQSLLLLTKFFHFCAESNANSTKELATNLCRSPRSQDNESGAVIWQYLTMSNKPSDNGDEHVKILTELLIHFKNDSKALEADILSASQKSPTHGWMITLGKCIDVLPKKHAHSKTSPIFEEITDVTIKVITFVLKLVFGKCNIDDDNDFGISADFCEMTERIERLTMENNIKKPDILLTEDHECILACCWLCVLRGSALLSSIAAVISCAPNNDDVLLKICNTYVTILTSCRHRGAIEGCFEALLNTCKVLFISTNLKYNAIPAVIVESVTESLHGNVRTGSNVTRRSAGIPLIIEAVLHAELLCKKDEHFHNIVVNIISLAQQVSHIQPQIDDDKFDYPQVHALYVLKHLFRNSQLGSHILKYAVDVFKIAIECSTSRLWVVRNAATHLFGAVANRMLGQKNIDSTHIEYAENSISSGEFFSHFPGLSHFIIEELKLSIPGSMEASFSRTLFPKSGCHSILSVLSKLTYEKHDFKNISQELVEVVTKLLDCRVYSVRCLSASSLLGLISVETALKYTTDFIMKIPLCYRDSNIDSNSLHGHLVFVELMTRKCSRLNLILEELMQRTWLWRTANIHPIIACTVLQIISNCLKCSVKDVDQFTKIAQEQLGIFLDNRLPNIMQQAVAERYWSTLTSMILNWSSEDERICFAKKCLHSDCAPVQMSILKWINGTSRDYSLNGLMAEMTVDFLLKNSSIIHKTLLCSCIETIIRIQSENTIHKNWHSLYRITVNVLSSNSPLSLQCHGLKMLSIVLVHLIKLQETNDELGINLMEVTSSWINHVSNRTSHAEASEPMRLSASKSLEIAGPDLLLQLLKMGIADKKQAMIDENVLIDLIPASLSLLHDEQPDIRKHACAFVSRSTMLPDLECAVIHQNVATKKFLCFLLHNFSHLHDVLNAIFNTCFRLHTKNSRKSKPTVLFDKNPFNGYEEPLEVAYLTVQCLLVTGKSVRSNLQNFIQGHRIKMLPFIMKQLREDHHSNFIDSLCLLLYIEAIIHVQPTFFQSNDSQSVLTSLSTLKQDITLHRELKKQIEHILSSVNENSLLFG